MTYKLMIVDDEQANLRLLERLFRRDYQIVTAGSGEEALVNIQHRAYNDSLGPANHGALVKISGFKVKSQHHDRDDDRQ